MSSLEIYVSTHVIFIYISLIFIFLARLLLKFKLEVVFFFFILPDCFLDGVYVDNLHPSSSYTIVYCLVGPCVLTSIAVPPP